MKHPLSMISDKDSRGIIRDALKRGWEIEVSGGGHIRLRHLATGDVVITSGSRCGGRGTANLLAQIKRVERSR
jgi:predicted RNA binding protein YcfA (HicA-like mRNA interferase family)